MKLSSAIVRSLLAFVAFCIIQMVTGSLLMTAPKTGLPANALPWLLLSNALAVATLTVVALRSDWRGWRLGAAVAGIPLIISCADAIEGMFFLTNSPIDWRGLFAYSFASAVLIMPVWILLFGRRATAPEELVVSSATRSLGERVGKFVVSDGAYALLYIVAGTIIFPYIKAFYATQQVPSMPKIFAMQLLVRGPIFLGVCLTLRRMLRLPRMGGALAVGFVFAILSGVVPLLVPNPFFPDAVRWAHLCETTSSNFLFGAIVAWLWIPAGPIDALGQNRISGVASREIPHSA